MREKEARVIVFVEWVDAQIATGETGDDEPLTTLAQGKSCGWLVEDTDEYLTIGMDRFADYFRTTQTIPKINIRRVRYFYPSKGRPAKGAYERIVAGSDQGVLCGKQRDAASDGAGKPG